MAFNVTNMGQQGSVAYSASDPNNLNGGNNVNPFLASAGTGVLGGLQTFAGFNGLNELGTLPNYTVSPEQQNAYNMALGNANQGYSQTERNNFNQEVAQQQNTAQRAAIDASGGQLSNAVSGTLNAQRLGAENQFAAQDNQIRRQNQQTYYNQAGDIQAQKNKATEAALADYNAKQKAYGGAAQSGLGNLGSYFNTLGTLLPLFA